MNQEDEEDWTPAMRLRGLFYGMLLAAFLWLGLWEIYRWLVA